MKVGFNINFYVAQLFILSFLISIIIIVICCYYYCFICVIGYRETEKLCVWQQLGLSMKYVRKIFRKTNISNPLIRTRTCTYQKVRNISFSESFAYVLNGRSHSKIC